MPGKLALRLRPGILCRLARGYRVILITGTNGKTTTTAMLQSILQKTGKRAISSASGANMKGGVVSCLLRAFPLFHAVQGDYAVLEVDEAYMRHITAEIHPEVIAVTNIFCDQLDRYGTVDGTLALIEEGCRKAGEATLVLNGDEPLFRTFLPQKKRAFFGFSVPISARPAVHAETAFCKTCAMPLAYDFVTLNHLGAYRCPSCGESRPTLQYAVEAVHALSAEASHVTMDGVEVTIPQAGAYNIYNALCAAACARVLGIGDAEIAEGISTQKSKFGRQETIRIQNADVRMILIKNPAGATEAIASVLPDGKEASVAVLLNDNVGDGKDVSWIYDVEFEQLSTLQLRNIFVGGTRTWDMAVRLKTAGFETLTICPTYEELLAALCKEEGPVYLFVTYSAMTGFRKLLYQKKFIRKLWE